GYITIDDLVERNLRTLETLGRLERFEGHLFNWYDLSTLEPLRPRYVSAVDSGNLLASLWTFETSCDELAARPLLDESALRGIADTLDRKSTRLNSSHVSISYAVFCLKKKTST